MNKIVLITGATAGIGKATAIKFAENGYDIIITGRRKNMLDETKLYIETNYKVNVLSLNFDISDYSQVVKTLDSIPQKWKKINVLVNNAGLAVGLNPIQDGIIDDWERMINTNIKGLLYITRHIVEYMIKNKMGHIINIGSVAGHEVYPSGNVYCATKFAVDALTKGMRMDLIKHKIKVTQISPGSVNTEFSNVRFKDDKEKAKNVYKGYEPLKAEDVASVIYYVTTLPANVNINDLTVTCIAQANALIINKEANFYFEVLDKKELTLYQV